MASDNGDGGHTREAVWQATNQASSIVRTLALAAVAMAWAFAGGFGSGVVENQKVIAELRKNGDLERALVLAVVALTLDVFQYVWTSANAALQFWYRRALFGPVHDKPTSASFRLGTRVAQLSGLYVSFENYVGLDSNLSYETRRQNIRELVVQTLSRKEWPPDTPEARTLAYLDQDLSHAMHLTNLAFAAKVLAVAASYVFILRFVI